ncbi:hypothetical protein K491DRAFT_599538 [Lophiostoma macrostomum CBS 122681]|uniref:RING-type E3 ubiquitin transferase n=1 Tax=Lophiostoma macrostomum CBS 122681 TaxID=1314788 RepID=A0A6A6T760_9PLEO|nr:hypothetical protein K491DRAFT_599538 [Lophiostoma macrostomum CBS 122681]
MRPVRLLLSLACSLVALTLLLYISFGSGDEQEIRTPIPAPRQSRLKALFSFSSPVSLFPPSAIISLTDDNSTFFLARPAAFGPLLPSAGLSSPLWIGSGFGDDTMGRGELGCSDVPGWSDGESLHAGSDAIVDAGDDDGTDDYLHLPVANNKTPKKQGGKSEHADIQSLQEGAEIAGKVVLLKRGGCGFLEKVKWAQRRGGVALIVGDDVRGGALIRMYAHGDTSNITIPALFTSHTTAHLLSSLLPSGGAFHSLHPEDVAKLEVLKNGKTAPNGKQTEKGRKKQESGTRPTSTRVLATATATSKKQRGPSTKAESGVQASISHDAGWFHSLRSLLGSGNSDRPKSKSDSRRPPSSGNIDWVLVEDWDDDKPGQTSRKTRSAKTDTTTATPAVVDFVIGEQDWRDPDLLAPQSSTKEVLPDSQSQQMKQDRTRGGSVLPSSGEYGGKAETTEAAQQEDGGNRDHRGWFSGWFSTGEEDSLESSQASSESTDSASAKTASWDATNDADSPPQEPSEEHEGLWVTLAPTNMSSSPFFDTLLVLVVSPLVTLTVVYALLLLRSRIRRRRWRAPKSVVERLPVRTYHTISDLTPSPAATPLSSSPTTPLLQHTHSQPASMSRPRSRTASEVPGMSSSVHAIHHSGRTPEEEKREAGLAAWRRRYGGRQRECVVCLEEYEDGVSRVMSLPCGHEFHADCITPWLVTRRRTCPICKGDVVRSLSQSYRDRGLQSPSPTRSARFFEDEADPLQAQAAQTRNDSPSASLPLAIPSASTADLAERLNSDIEAHWDDDRSEPGEEAGQTSPRDRVIDLSSSVSQLSSTVTTTIWRGFDAIRGATGLQRRPSHEEVDRDR